MIDLWRKLGNFFGPQDKGKLFSLVVFTGMAAFLETIGVGIVMPFIGLLADPGLVAKNKYLSQAYEWSHAGSHTQFIYYCGLALIAFYLLKNSFLALLTHFQNRYLFRKHVEISRGLLGAYLHRPYPFHLERNSAELIRNLAEVGTIFHGVLLPMLAVITELMVLVLVVAMLVAIEPLQTIVAAAALGGATFVFYGAIKKKLKKFGEQKQHFSEMMIKWVQQGLGGIKETKVLEREEFFLCEYVKSVEGYTQAARYAATAGVFPKLFIEALAVTGIVIMVFVMLWQGREMASVLPTLGLFALATVRIMPSMTRIVSNLAIIRFCRPSVDLVSGDLSLIGEETPAVKGPPRPGQTALRLIELKGVSFNYAKASAPAVDNLDLTVKQGESVAFIGASGAGKTTLVDLILGLLEPTSGVIEVNGQPISGDMSAWRSRVGYIPQSIYLTDDTIRKNVAFGTPDEKIDDQAVWRALRAAQLEEFVKAGPLGLAAMVGERGVRLSGGQRQRIGIARALYRDPEVLVLDEATSALDNETEREVTAAIENLSGKKTIFLIAHRLSTAKKCDRIFKMAAGRIISSGTFEQVVGDA